MLFAAWMVTLSAEPVPAKLAVTLGACVSSVRAALPSKRPPLPAVALAVAVPDWFAVTMSRPDAATLPSTIDDDTVGLTIVLAW